ncbi:hypothetical protein [Pontibacter sp. BAB1700]|uniref:hypothetical protein n=1 Tax=Pontibacter sp. BAB1700 TaxID=1144253 RepID=UPI00026BE432|nr:hypothetical protein [Pontibacter sp. BAB1700]EJF08890.1 hypothetical protein O71_18281 [Pontibacter sp. BAB1700]
MDTPSEIQFPDILTANTYRWGSSAHASGRRYNERKRQMEVSSFFEKLGFRVTLGEDSLKATIDKIEVYFTYYETCKNVYKTFTVYRDGKKSNITVLRKYANMRTRKIDNLLAAMDRKAA